MTEANEFINCAKCKDLLTGTLCENGIEVWGDGEALRLENNPAVWGAHAPKIYLLGFSKGGTQNQELLKVKAGVSAFADIPFKGMRHRLQWLLEALGVINGKDVDSLFRSTEQDIQSASLVRCSLSARTESGKYSYKMKDILLANPALLENIASNCVKAHLESAEPGSMLILLGLDPAYIKLCKRVVAKVFCPVTTLTETTYQSGGRWFAHAAHPSSNQTDPQYKRWVAGETKKPKVAWARDAVERSGAVNG